MQTCPMGEAPAGHVFVSYSSADRSIVQRLVEAMRKSGLTIRWDENLHPGDEWAVRLASMFDEAAAIVVAWSKESAQSNRVIDEASEARAAGACAGVAQRDGVRSRPVPGAGHDRPLRLGWRRPGPALRETNRGTGEAGWPGYLAAAASPTAGKAAPATGSGATRACAPRSAKGEGGAGCSRSSSSRSGPLPLSFSASRWRSPRREVLGPRPIVTWCSLRWRDCGHTELRQGRIGAGRYKRPRACPSRAVSRADSGCLVRRWRQSFGIGGPPGRHSRRSASCSARRGRVCVSGSPWGPMWCGLITW